MPFDREVFRKCTENSCAGRIVICYRDIEEETASAGLQVYVTCLKTSEQWVALAIATARLCTAYYEPSFTSYHRFHPRDLIPCFTLYRAAFIGKVMHVVASRRGGDALAELEIPDDTR